MSDCCTLKGSAQTCGKVLSDERALSRCIECRVEGRPVERQTVLHHVKHEHLDRVNGAAYRFCPDPNCEIVYYGDGETRFTVDDLRELVTVKTTGDARPLCYCFDFTEGDAREEIERTGGSTVPAGISALIKAGMCACEVRNPAGVCCLGQVNQVVKRLSDEHRAATEPELVTTHDCCAGC